MDAHDELASLMQRVALSLNKQAGDLAIFEAQLRRNWYDTQMALQTLTDDQFMKMNIPLRLATVIRKEIGNSEKQFQQLSAGNIQQAKAIQSAKNQEYSGLKEEGAPEKPDSGSRGLENKKEDENDTSEGLSQQKLILIVGKTLARLEDYFKSDGEARIKTAETLSRIVKNIINDPSSIKFRLLKSANKVIRSTVLSCPPCVKFLTQIRFRECEEGLVMEETQLHELLFIDQCLDQMLITLTEREKIKSNQQYEHFLAVKQFPKGEDEIQKQFSAKNLEEANYAQVLSKLVSYRNSLMQKAPSRRIKIYHQRWVAKDKRKIDQVDIGQEMSDDRIIGQYWQRYLLQSNKATQFQSRRKVEFEFLLKQKVYRETLVKVKLPNELIVEAYFAPLETLADVFKVVSSVVIGEIYMYTTPPVKKMDKELNWTLAELDCVPSGLFYLGITDEWYIRKEFADQIIK